MKNTLLPPNRTTLETATEQATDRFDNIAVELVHLWDAQTCPARFLPWLAWSLAVDEWDNQWSEQQKRNVIENAIYVHRHKGTAAAMRRAIESLGYDATFTEWFEHSGQTPGTFNVVLAQPDKLTAREINAIYRIIENTKNVRSHMASLEANIDIHVEQPVQFHQEHIVILHLGTGIVVFKGTILDDLDEFLSDNNNVYVTGDYGPETVHYFGGLADDNGIVLGDNTHFISSIGAF